jgi:hypothetical protein
MELGQLVFALMPIAESGAHAPGDMDKYMQL